jgi:hypothetical protein
MAASLSAKGRTMEYTKRPAGTDRDAADLINEAVKDNPDVLRVLAIAARAREVEAREVPREIRVATEAAAIAINIQTAV